MIDVRDAWNILAAATPLGEETVPLAACEGRVLASAWAVDRDLPPFDRAAMDGFALRASDAAGASRTAPVRLRVVGEATPGIPHAGRCEPGEAVRIMTGAAVPEECDSVLPVEESSGFDGDPVSVFAPLRRGANVALRGCERRRG